jgi:hypothetical protein
VRARDRSIDRVRESFERSIDRSIVRSFARRLAAAAAPAHARSGVAFDAPSSRSHGARFATHGDAGARIDSNAVARRPRRGLGGFASRARATIDSNAPTPRASRSTSARVRASIDDALVRAAGDRRANAPRGRRCLNHRAMAARARARARARTTSRGRHRRGGAGVSRRDAMRCDATRWDASSSSRARTRDSRGENPEEEFTSRVARGRGRGVGASRRSNARGFVAARARRDSRHPRGVTLDASRDVRASGSARDETMRGRRDETHARFGD